MDSYDIVVIGSGQAGEALAMVSARGGLATALIDDGQQGSNNINAGAAPSNALIASANIARIARRAADFGV